MAIPRKALKGLPSGWDAEAIAVLVELYEAAARRLRSIAEQRLVTDGRQLTVAAKRARLAMIEVEAVLRDLDYDAAKWIAEYIPEAYRRGALETAKGLREVGAAGAFSFDVKFHQDAINLLVADMQDTLLVASDQIKKGFRNTLRRTQTAALTDKAITANIAKAQITGETRVQLAKSIKRELVKQFGDGPVVINGRRYDMGKYAEMVARTKTREAVTAGEINRLIEAGHDLVIITSHNTKCEVCAFFEGRVFSISGTSEKYPPLSQLLNGGPPFHPNCLHNIAPFVEELSSGAERRRGADIDKRVLGKSQKEIAKLGRA